MREARRFGDGAIATPHYLASAAGAEVLAAGGNAVDAIVAANLALGVVAPYFCGYGGDLLAMVWDGSLHGYESVGRAPAAATVESVRAAAGVDEMPAFGPHAVTVPGAVHGWFTLLERFGSRSFGDLAATALRLAEEGFPLTRRGAQTFEGIRYLHERDAFSASLIERYSAGATQPGMRLRQETLARTIRALAEHGPDYYYCGPIGAAIVDTLAGLGGLMTVDDFAAHQGRFVDPLRASYGDAEVCELPPPTQGVTVLEALAILAGLDLGKPGVDRDHLLVEASKLALASRDAHVGDPDAMTVSAEELLAADRIATRRRLIDPSHRVDPPVHASVDGGTAYMCCADSNGLLVSLIQSNFTAIGAGVHVSEWGVNLHNRGSSFRLTEGHANSMGPSKRPMHTLVPGMVMRDVRPWIVFGTMGGHAQAPVQVQVLTRLIVDGAEPQAALEAPRWAVDPGTWRLDVEGRFADEWQDEMRAKGHEVTPRRKYDDGMGHAHAIVLEAEGYAVATDPRAEGAALGY